MPRRKAVTLGIFFVGVCASGYLLNTYRPVPAPPGQTGWSRPSGEGVRLMNEGRLADAEAKFRAALAMAEADRDDLGRGTSLQNLGQLKLATKQHREAEELLRQSLPLLDSSAAAPLNQRAVVLSNLAICCIEDRRTAEAVSLMKRAVDLDDDPRSDVTPAERARRLRNYAITLLADGRPVEAADAVARANALEGSGATTMTTTTLPTAPSARE